MRARRAGSKAALDLPAWVTVRGDPSTDAPPSAHCNRCDKSERLLGPKQDAEKALGRFALYHRRCPDPALIAEAARQAQVDRRRAAERDAWFAQRRRERN